MAKKDIEATEAVQETERDKAISSTETTSEKKGNEDAETLGEDTEESANESREKTVAASGIPQVVKNGALRSFELYPHLKKVYVISNGCAFTSIQFAQDAARYLEDPKVYTIEK